MSAAKATRRGWLPRGWWIVAAVLVMLGGLAVVWISLRGDEVDFVGLVETVRSSVLVGLQQVPLPVYLLAFMVFPAFGFPITPFYLTVAVMMGGIWQGLLATWACVAVCLALGYWLAASVARPVVSRFVERRSLKIPTVTLANARRITLLVRLSPLPLVMQNFVLGLGQVPFRLYLFWSVLVQGVLSAGVIVVGESLFQGNARLLLPGLFLVLLVVTGISWWRHRVADSKADGLGT